MLLLSNKMYENFTTTQALDAVKATENKVNDIFSKIDTKKVTMNKHLHLDNILSLGQKEILLKNAKIVIMQYIMMKKIMVLL